jgi:cation transport ATPase
MDDRTPTAHRSSRRRWLRRLPWMLAVTVLAGVVAPVGRVVASPLDDASPSSEGMPGGPQVVQFLSWAMWLGLAASGGAIIYGAATWRGWGSASSSRAVEGKTYVLAGLVGAFVLGLAATAVSLMFNAGRS